MKISVASMITRVDGYITVRAKATRKPPKKRVLVESSSQSSLPDVGSKYHETEALTECLANARLS